ISSDNNAAKFSIDTPGSSVSVIDNIFACGVYRPTSCKAHLPLSLTSAHNNAAVTDQSAYLLKSVGVKFCAGIEASRLALSEPPVRSVSQHESAKQCKKVRPGRSIDDPTRDIFFCIKPIPNVPVCRVLNRSVRLHFRFSAALT